MLADRMPAALATEIDLFESQIALRRQGKIEEKVFAETRLRRGVYGQRYDNGQRNDGTGTKPLRYPSNGLTKGPDTVWDAPGMQRIKIPFGGLTPDQMDVLADLAEEYSDDVCHITTRQDIQLHYVHIEDTPDLMRRLAAVGITTREACGNSVRNVTACPLAGVCRDEAFDVSPYAHASMRFLLGHPDVQDFGRKFKVAFSGCREHACGLVSMHDLGFIARTTVVDGVERRGFETYVGGGLGAVPHKAKMFDEFLPEEELLPLAQAIARVFARLGEKKNRARARISLVDETGQPKILDFGIARVTDSDVQATLQTSAGEVVGTLPYMSPEQIAADPLELDTRSDVYALGVILYELLARRLPIDVSRRNLTEAARAITDDEPAPLREADTTLDGDVERIVTKALEKQKNERYQSAADLAADIRRYLADEPIAARPLTALYQLRKFTRRHRALVGGAAATLAALVVGLVATGYFMFEARAERDRAEQEATKAVAINDFLQETLGSANPYEGTGREVSVLDALGVANQKIRLS